MNEVGMKKIVQVIDGWKNVLTGLGVKGKDKRLGISVEWQRMPQDDAEHLYAADDISEKIVDLLPSDMLREGFIIKTDDKRFPNLNTDLQNWLDEKDINKILLEGMSWGRLYGGAATIIGINDGQDAEVPVNENNIQSVDFFSNLNRWELHRWKVQRNPLAKDFGMPELYQMQPHSGGEYLGNIHATRLVRWEGARLPRKMFIANNYWGDSVLTRPRNAVQNFQATYDSAAALIQDFAQAVYKIKNLTEMIAMGKDDLVAKRLALVDRTRSVVNAIVLEDGEEFDRKVTTITGIPELLDAMARRLVMATEIPHTRLLGESPSGLGATGESEITDWYDYVARKQETDLKPQLNRIIHLVLLSKTGPTGGIEPENWRVEFNPLKQQSQKEITETRYIQAQSDKLYWEMGALGADEIANSRFGGDEYSYETKMDNEGRERVEEVDKNPPVDEPEATV